ncbi:MAG: hypothetical protein WCK94_09920 [Comamonadaceae bacterium]|jgi:hypothetical protein
MTILKSACSAFMAALLVACGGGGGGGGSNGNPTITSAPAGTANCSASAPLSRSPVAVSALSNIVPLGNLNPQGGHVFPTDHQYFFTSNTSSFTTLTNVVAPASIVITNVQQQTRSGGGMPTLVDYAMTFFPCADVKMTFGHLSSIAPALLSQIGSFGDACNPSYNINGVNYQQCNKSVSIAVAEGVMVGTMGGTNQQGFDVGAYDRRTTLAFVNPTRSTEQGSDFNPNHTACFIDYIAGADADAMRAILGSGGSRRTIAPVCGQAMQDIAGTAQGRWFLDASSSEPQGVALVHDNVDPTQAVISVGNSVPSLGIGTYVFKPTASGKINADFSRVTADGTVYCFEPSPQADKHIVLQMPTGSTLLIAGVSGSNCGSGFVMPVGATPFSR